MFVKGTSALQFRMWDMHSTQRVGLQRKDIPLQLLLLFLQVVNDGSQTCYFPSYVGPLFRYLNSCLPALISPLSVWHSPSLTPLTILPDDGRATTKVRRLPLLSIAGIHALPVVSLLLGQTVLN